MDPYMRMMRNQYVVDEYFRGSRFRSNRVWMLKRFGSTINLVIQFPRMGTPMPTNAQAVAADSINIHVLFVLQYIDDHCGHSDQSDHTHDGYPWRFEHQFNHHDAHHQIRQGRRIGCPCHCKDREYHRNSENPCWPGSDPYYPMVTHIFSLCTNPCVLFMI
jgi:hypothetical protein